MTRSLARLGIDAVCLAGTLVSSEPKRQLLMVFAGLNDAVEALFGTKEPHTSMSWAQLAIDVNNALCQGIGEVARPVWERIDSSIQLPVDVIVMLIYLVTCLLLLGQEGR